MHTEEYDVLEWVKNDNANIILKQHVTPNGNPH
jgi:hypothetical protein